MNGNLTRTDTNRHYDWNAGDELVHYRNQPMDGPLFNESHHFYAGGQRVKKLIRDSAGHVMEATVYIDGIFEHRYQSGGAQQTSMQLMDGRSKIATLRTGDELEGGIPHFTYELEDHLGSSTVRLDSGGGFVDSEEYYPFGESSLRQFRLKRYGYVGKEYEVESGLHYYGARFYAAWTCRFISVDPLAAKYSQLTPYNYAGNRPIGDLDIDGLQATGQDSAETGEQSESQSATFSSGNKVFDYVANTVKKEGLAVGKEVKVHAGNGPDGYAGTIEYEGTIIHYDPVNGFIQNGTKVVPTDEGLLVDPSPLHDFDGRLSGGTLYTPLDL